MTIRVYIDHNIWDFLYDHNIKIADYFPETEFTLAIAKHGRFELDQMPDDGERALKKAFIFDSLISAVQEVHTFGFHDPRHSPEHQRSSGFGLGEFSCVTINQERRRLNAIYGGKGRRKPSMILERQEADIELGALSMEHYVLTLDKKRDPLKDSSDNGGKVIFLNELETVLGPTTLQTAADKIRSIERSKS